MFACNSYLFYSNPIANPPLMWKSEWTTLVGCVKTHFSDQLLAKIKDFGLGPKNSDSHIK